MLAGCAAMAHRFPQDRRAGFLGRRIPGRGNQHELRAPPVSTRGCRQDKGKSARPDFALPIYPGHLATADGKLNPNVPVTSKAPPTFLVQAEDDYVDGVKQSLVYYAALAKAHVPAEMHLYANGGHAFGLRRTKLPITDWPRLAEAWLRTIGIVQD